MNDKMFFLVSGLIAGWLLGAVIVAPDPDDDADCRPVIYTEEPYTNDAGETWTPWHIRWEGPDCDTVRSNEPSGDSTP